MALAFKTKHLAIYEELRKDIVDGKIKPGEKIKISDVARKYELSEIPVREAIRRLESEGFVEFTPYVGATVCKMDKQEFIEIYLIRIEIEALAARLAAEHVSPKDIQHLKKLNKEMAAALEHDTPEALGDLNKQFHLSIYNAAPYPTLNKLISDLWEKVERTQECFLPMSLKGQKHQLKSTKK